MRQKQTLNDKIKRRELKTWNWESRKRSALDVQLAEIKLFLIFLGSIGFDLLIGDPRFLIHPVQVIGFYIKKISDYLINNFGENKNILFWGGLIIAISTIGMSFGLGKLIELSYVQSRNNIFCGLLIFFGLSSCIATKGLISSVKEIVELIKP